MDDAIDRAPQCKEEGDSERSSEEVSTYGVKGIFMIPTNSAVHVVKATKPCQTTRAIYTAWTVSSNRSLTLDDVTCTSLLNATCQCEITW